MPEWLLQLLMPVAASQLLRKVYHPHTFQTKPQLIRTAWLSLVSVKPWVMQAQCPQVGAMSGEQPVSCKCEQRLSAVRGRMQARIGRSASHLASLWVVGACRNMEQLHCRGNQAHGRHLQVCTASFAALKLSWLYADRE